MCPELLNRASGGSSLPLPPAVPCPLPGVPAGEMGLGCRGFPAPPVQHSCWGVKVRVQGLAGAPGGWGPTIGQGPWPWTLSQWLICHCFRRSETLSLCSVLYFILLQEGTLVGSDPGRHLHNTPRTDLSLLTSGHWIRAW